MSETFSSNLSKLRKERGMSQKDAAAGLGISQALLSHYENGIRECGLDFLMRAADFYSVTTDYLLGISDSKQGFAGAFTIKDDIDTDKWMNTLTIYRVASRMRECFTSAKESEDYADEFHKIYGMMLYRIMIAEVKKGNFPKSWIPNEEIVDNKVYAQIINILEDNLMEMDHSKPHEVEDSDGEAPQCVKTLVEYIQHYIHETCSEMNIEIPSTGCIKCTKES